MQNDGLITEKKSNNFSKSTILNLVILKNRESAMLWIMVVLQVLWLISIGFLGASSDWGRLIGISIYSR